MSERSGMRKGTVAIIALTVVATVGILWYAVKDVRESRAQIAESRLRYLKSEAVLASARQDAKEKARQEVARHGKRATVEQRKKAHDVVMRKVGRPKGPKAFFEAARFARARVEGTWKLHALPNRAFTEEEKEILEAADQAVSEHDIELAVAVAEEALKSEDARVRLRAVETLTEFGEAGLPELADFLSDPHTEVANLAADRFELGVQEVETESEQVALTKLGMLSVADEDQLRALGGTLMLASDSLRIVQTLADVIRNGTKVQSAIAKETYQNQTGEPWQGEEAADKWLRENYTPPESDESEPAEQDQQGEDNE